MTSRTLDKAQKELAQGNLWRAKEILQGAIKSERYDVQLYELMGTVFLRMGDLPEAGRFLFLSGVRKPEYLESIEIFISKHRKNQPRAFLYLFPRNARLKTLSDYPGEVAQTLREMGFPKVLKDENGKVYLPEPGNGIVGSVACGTIALVTLALIILGIIKLLEMIR